MRSSSGPIEVGRLAQQIGASQPNVSQHLAVLRTAGLVDAERDGREVRYRLADADVDGRLRGHALGAGAKAGEARSDGRDVGRRSGAGNHEVM